MANPIFTGSGVAIVTPFHENGVDFDAYRERIKVLEERCSMLEKDNYKLERQVMMYEKLIERL